MKIAICDDEYITAEYYYEQIEQIFKEYSTECEIDLFTDSGKLLTSLYEGKRWDVCFLDIDMPLVDGLSLGQKLRELDMYCYLIYVSIHRECVYESFKARPFRFIPKDEFQSQISGCIADILADCRTESEQDYVTFENRTSMYRFRIDDIIYHNNVSRTAGSAYMETKKIGVFVNGNNQRHCRKSGGLNCNGVQSVES